MVRCPECGYGNSPRYQFCGMCGILLPNASQSSLKQEKAGPAESQPDTTPVSGPSFLGLDSEPKNDTSYLLEDDEPRHGHGKMYFALLLLVLAGVLLTLHWQRDGYPWETAAKRRAHAVKESSSSPVAPDVSPAEQSPAPTTPASTQSSQAVASGSTESPVGNTTQEPKSPPSEVPTQATPTPVEKEGSASSEPATPVPQTSEPQAQTVSSKSATPRNPELQPAVSQADSDEQLVATGEKYLYGNGVPQDCARAQKNLLTAGFHSNVKAQSLLGSMYASGHCVTRDLPTAYRWFAHALHEEPENTRIASDLDALWRQMTPAEKKAALRAE